MLQAVYLSLGLVFFYMAGHGVGGDATADGNSALSDRGS